MCGRETLYQRVTSGSVDYFFCSLDFQRTHTVPANEILPSSEPKPKPAPEKVKVEPIRESVRDRVVENRLELREFESERVVDKVPDPENYRNDTVTNPDSSKPTVNLRQGTDLHDMQAKMERDAGLWQSRRARRPLTGDSGTPQS